MPFLVPLLALLASSGAEANQPIPKPVLWSAAKIGALNPKEVPHALLGDFGRDLVLDVNHYSHHLFRQSLSSLHFLSAPRWSHNPGLCEITEVELSFQRAYPAGSVPAGEELARPTRVSSQPSYFIIDESRVQPRGAGSTDDDRARQQARCSEVDPLSVHRIRASGPWEVSRAMRHLQSLVAEARSGNVARKLDCDGVGASGWPTMSGEQCVQMVRGLTPTQMTSVWSCRTPSVWCSKIDIQGYLIEIVTDERMQPVEFRVGRYPPLPPPPVLY